MAHSCSALLNGEIFVFGGYDDEYQVIEAVSIRLLFDFKISKVSGCELKRIGDLSYDFDFGTCATFRFPEERIMLCFGYSSWDGCER